MLTSWFTPSLQHRWALHCMVHQRWAPVCIGGRVLAGRCCLCQVHCAGVMLASSGVRYTSAVLPPSLFTMLVSVVLASLFWIWAFYRFVLAFAPYWSHLGYIRGLYILIFNGPLCTNFGHWSMGDPGPQLPPARTPGLKFPLPVHG